jgi:hypothetical protein
VSHSSYRRSEIAAVAGHEEDVGEASSVGIDQIEESIPIDSDHIHRRLSNHQPTGWSPAFLKTNDRHARQSNRSSEFKLY